MRFTIRSLMVAVLVVAILLAIPGWDVAIVGLVSLPGFIFTAARWLVIRGRRRLAAAGFWVMAVLANTLYAAACMAPVFDVLFLLYYIGWFLVVLPTIIGLGTAWAMLSSAVGAVPRRPRPFFLFAIFLAGVFPAVTLITFWPVRIGFLAARPAMERLADRVAAGKAVALPQRAGLYRVVKAASDPASGDIALMIVPIPNRSTGFVRVGPGPHSNRRPTIVGTNQAINLGGGWWYRQEY